MSGPGLRKSPGPLLREGGAMRVRDEHGVERELPADEARALIAAGRATPVASDRHERAVAGTGEVR